MKNLFITLCGTSILTNVERKYKMHPENFSLFIKYANERNNGDIPEEHRNFMEKYIGKALDELNQKKDLPFSDEEISRVSAEINSYSKLFTMEEPTKSDFHYLLSTDTWLGEQAAILVKTWLEQKGINGQVFRMNYVQTDSTDELQIGLSDLIKWMDNVVVPFREKGYKVIFNISGGFKVLMGFMQTIAHFYSDEAVYIFENGKELIKIPRLPIQLDVKEKVINNLNIFRKASMGIDEFKKDLSRLPELFYYQIGDDLSLSAWGELAYAMYKKEAYSASLLPALTDRIIYSETFRKKAEELPPDRLYILNIQIDQLSRFLMTNDPKYNLKNLSFKQLAGKPVEGSTHEFYAWSDRDAKRVMCHFEGNKLVLDKLHEHL